MKAPLALSLLLASYTASAGCTYIYGPDGGMQTICDYQAAPVQPYCHIVFVNGTPINVCGN